MGRRRGPERKPEAREAAQCPDAAAVRRLAERARLALMALYTEVAAGKSAVTSDAMEAMGWSTARLGIDVLTDLVVRPEHPRAHEREELVRVLDFLRRGRSVLRALDLTEQYAADVRVVESRKKAEPAQRKKSLPVEREAVTRLSAKIRHRLARDYVIELKALGLDELEGSRVVPLKIVAAELANEAEPRSAKPRGPAMILARLLVLHRDGVLDERAVGKLRDAIAKVRPRSIARLASLARQGE